MPLTKDSREFIECLRSSRVEFLVVGALAVSWHGFPRYSGDIDFFIRPGRENALRVIAALERFGFGGLGITPDDLSTENRVIQEAWLSRVPGALGTVEVDFIGREALIRNKRASGRSKDLIDVDQLTRGCEE